VSWSTFVEQAFITFAHRRNGCGLAECRSQGIAVNPADLALANRVLVANTPRRTHAYFSSSRTRMAPSDPTGRRKEERLAMAWFIVGVLKILDSYPIRLLD
jgi:hypothetical protein